MSEARIKNWPDSLLVLSPITYFAVDDVAAQLKVSRREVLTWIEAGQLTGQRTRRYWRFTGSDLQQFLDARGLPFDEQDWLCAREARLQQQRRKTSD